jgi:dTDP-4-amino-4,6-dideoxygalactose transaminase
MKVPMLDLTEQYQSIKEEVNASMEDVMSNAHFILGSNVKQLEETVSNMSDIGFGVGVANGSDALHLSLLACGVEPGDEVIVPAFTFFATGGAVARIGAVPVFADIDPKTFNIDPDSIRKAITDKTKAIIPVHLYGQMADMEEISAIAKENNLAVVEDAAQAIGSKLNNVGVGQLGTTATYSFFPTKNLGAYGDGGMVVTKDEEIAEKLRVLRVHGSKPKYYHHVLGYNSRLDELHAAVLNIKVKYLNKWTEMRRENANYYSELIKTVDEVKTPYIAENSYHVFHQYTLRVEKRDELQKFLKENGIATMIYYPMPLHLQPVFGELGYKEGDLPVTEEACKEALSLPMFPELKREQQEYVVNKIKEFYAKG